MANPSCDDAELVIVRLGELGEENVPKSSPALPCRLPTAFVYIDSVSALSTSAVAVLIPLASRGVQSLSRCRGAHDTSQLAKGTGGEQIYLKLGVVPFARARPPHGQGLVGVYPYRG